MRYIDSEAELHPVMPSSLSVDDVVFARLVGLGLSQPLSTSARGSYIQLDMLRDHKPPPIRRIWISDFGLPDPKHDPDRHQNCITWSLSHAYPSKKFRQNPFTSLRVIQRTDRQTDRTKNITSFLGGGNQGIDYTQGNYCTC